jgi:dienelactone hydrolase
MLSILLFILFNTTGGFLLPNPPGKYNVTLTTGPLIDYTRSDNDTATPTPRALMLSVFQPFTVPVSNMPNKTAEYQGPWLQKAFNLSADLTPLFLAARLPVCPDDSDGCVPLDDVPILIFDPGYGFSRLYYNVIASAIASEGFIVITIDHPGDSNIITYPDGHAVYYDSLIPLTPDELAQHVYSRAADASFVIDQLGNATAIAELLPQRGPQTFPTDRVAMLGHSLGGASAIIAASRDPRIRGAMNWDGTVYGSLPSSGLSQPALFVSSANRADASWEAAWPQLKGPKLWLTVANVTHQGLSDSLVLVQAAGLDAAAFAGFVGTLAPAEMLQIYAAYTTAWMHGAFTGKVGGLLLQGQEPDRFPEVSIVMKGNF